MKDILKWSAAWTLLGMCLPLLLQFIATYKWKAVIGIAVMYLFVVIIALCAAGWNSLTNKNHNQ
jgi:hypothetical protein